MHHLRAHGRGSIRRREQLPDVVEEAYRQRAVLVRVDLDRFMAVMVTLVVVMVVLIVGHA